MELVNGNTKWERRRNLMMCLAGYAAILATVAFYFLIVNYCDEDDSDDDNDDANTVEGDEYADEDDDAIDENDGEDVEAGEYNENAIDDDDDDGSLTFNADDAFNDSDVIQDEVAVSNSTTNDGFNHDNGDDDGAAAAEHTDESAGGVLCQQLLLQGSPSAMSSLTSSPKGKKISEDKLRKKMAADIMDVAEALKGGHLIHWRTEFPWTFNLYSSSQRSYGSAENTQDKLLERVVANLNYVLEELKNVYLHYSNINLSSSLNGIDGLSDQSILEKDFDTPPQKRSRLNFLSLSPGA